LGGKLGSAALVGISEGNSGLRGFSSLKILYLLLDISFLFRKIKLYTYQVPPEAAFLSYILTWIPSSKSSLAVGS
jgi:hypothetical protein